MKILDRFGHEILEGDEVLIVPSHRGSGMEQRIINRIEINKDLTRKLDTATGKWINVPCLRATVIVGKMKKYGNTTDLDTLDPDNTIFIYEVVGTAKLKLP